MRRRHRDFIYDDPHDVAPFGSDYEVYERTSTGSLDAATKDEIRRLRDDYDRIADKSSREARDAVGRLCEKKNGPAGTGDTGRKRARPSAHDETVNTPI